METKDQAIQIAKTHLQLRGYNGFSFQDIADELGIKKASLHYYFSSKEDLGLALIQDYGSAFQQWAESIEDLDSSEKIKKFFLMFYQFAQDNLKVCPAGVFCIDYNTLPPKMQKAVTVFQETQRTWLEKICAQGLKSKVFSDVLSAKDMASLIMSTSQGSLQVARMQNNSRVMKSTCLALLDLLTGN